MAILKSISFPKFDSSYDYLMSLDSQESAVREGLGFYKALAMLLNGDMAFSVEDSKFVAPNKDRSIAKVCKENGWNQSQVSKAATVIRTYVEGYADLDATELREQVIALVTNYGSVHAAYSTVVPPKETGGKNGDGNTPKSARELVIVALRRHLSDGGDLDGFADLVGDVVASWEADNTPKGDGKGE